MPRFTGFPAGNTRPVALPGEFFSELLPQIDHLGELKVALYALWFFEQVEGRTGYIRDEDFHSDQGFMAGLGSDPAAAGAALEDGLQRSIRRGTLLCARLGDGDSGQVLYLLNSPHGRAALQALLKGDWSPGDEPHQPVELAAAQPNIYRLYEENIGPLTPMIADTLREAEQTYPAHWLNEAVRIAVENNVRRWRYIDAILRSWQEEGRDDPNRRYSEKDRRRYTEGPFADFIEH